MDDGLRTIWKRASRRRGQTESGEGLAFPFILNMCPEVRALILNNLELHDLKMVRQVCHSLKVDTDQDLVGVSATFQPLESEPEPGRIGRVIRYLSGKQTPEKNETRIEEMLAWLGKVTVKSLQVRRLSVFPFQPASLKHPLQLRRLILDFDEESLAPETRTKVSQMLNLFDNLAIFNITVRAPWRETVQEEVDVYRAAVSSLVEEVWLGLQYKPSLKEVSVVANSRLLENYSDWPGEIEPIEDFPHLTSFTRGLRNLEVHLPYRLYDKKATNWKALLDGQEQLERLKVNIGTIYWRAGYSMVLQKHSQSLRHLDLFLSTAINNEQIRTTAVPIPQEQWLDWNEIATAQGLESLRINQSAADDQYPGLSRIRSLYFLTFDLPHLRRLELRYIFLGHAEFQQIFLGFGLRCLQYVLLEYWTEDQEASDERDADEASAAVLILSIERARNICDVLSQALPLNRFESVRLTNYTIYKYPQVMRDRIPELPNYSVTWPEKWSCGLVISKI